MNIRLFQFVVASSTVIYIVWFFLPYWSGYLSDDEYRLAEYTGYGAILPVNHFLYYSTGFCLWLISAIGLFFFQNWARHLFLALSLSALAAVSLSGFLVAAPVDAFLLNANLLLDGVILALAYLTPLAASFKARPNPAVKRDAPQAARPLP
jgi:hypothetical protein